MHDVDALGLKKFLRRPVVDSMPSGGRTTPCSTCSKAPPPPPPFLLLPIPLLMLLPLLRDGTASEARYKSLLMVGWPRFALGQGWLRQRSPANRAPVIRYESQEREKTTFALLVLERTKAFKRTNGIIKLADGLY